MEMATRVERVRRSMDAQGIDALVVFGPECQYWLSGLESFISGVLVQGLLVPAARKSPMVLVVWDADEPLARSTSDVETILGYRFGVDDPIDCLARALADIAPGVRTIGFDSGSRAVPFTVGRALVEALAPARCVDCSAMLADVRLVKSEAELAHLRRAGSFADIGLEAALANARPGTSERELAAEIEYAMRRAGSDYASIPTELTSGSRSVLVHGTPGHRLLEEGDLVHVEVGGVELRYNAVGLQTFGVGGRSVPAVGQRLYDVARSCLAAGLESVKPGVEAREVEAPALRLLRAAGLEDGFKMRFGYGVGVGYPPTWLDPFQITRTSHQILEPGIAFVLHACLLDEPSEVGVVVGGTYAVNETGFEQIAGAGSPPMGRSN